VIGSAVNSAHVIFDMETIEGPYRVCAGKNNTAEDDAYYTKNIKMAEKLLDELRTTFSCERASFCRPDNWAHQKIDLGVGLSSRFPTRSLEPPSYDQPPPPYDDVVHDLPPEYSALPPLAQRESIDVSFARKTRQKTNSSSSLLKDHMLDVRIDFENPTGVREHKKKKPAAAKKAATPPTPPPPPPPEPTGGADGGDDNSNGDNAGGAGGDGAGGGDGDGGDDWGDDWNVSGKKDKKKKEQEEEERKAKEEEERIAKEEEERLAKEKEEDERKAKEEEERKAAEASAANNLSWAEDDGGGDSSWAAFTNVGKKKKGKVRPSSITVLRCASK
jgi:hypothetical protein